MLGRAKTKIDEINRSTLRVGNPCGTAALQSAALQSSALESPAPYCARYRAPLVIAFLFVSSLIGCASWSNEAEGEPSRLLPKPRQSLDSVVVETVLVRFPKQSVEDLRSLWVKADESILDIETRQRLDNNGLRAGVLIGELPKLIRDRIAATSSDQDANVLEHAGLAADVDNKMRLLQCRAGRRKELFIRREVADGVTVLSTRDGEVSGDRFEAPAILFDLRAIPHGDQRASLELIPEVQHGVQKQTFVSTEFGVRPEIRRDRQVWDDLAVKATLRPGQVLMLAGTQPPKAVGKAFFTTQTADRTEEHVVLLLRVAEMKLDDLFAPDEVMQAAAMTER